MYALQNPKASATFEICTLKTCYKIHWRSNRQLAKSVPLTVWYDLSLNTEAFYNYIGTSELKKKAC